jgi:hypothetical protein
MLKKIVILLSLLLLQSELWSQAILATLKFDSSTVLIGDQLRGSIIVNSPQGQEFGFPIVADYWKGKNIEIYNLSDQEKQNSDGGKQIVKQSVSLIFWDTGTYVLPALPFSYVNGDKTDTVFAEGITIEVGYPAGVIGDSTYMAPIKPILSESKIFLDYLIEYQGYIYGLLGLGLLAVLIYFIIKMQKAAADKKGRLTPEGRALKALEELLAMDFIAKKQYADYHEQISWIIREYLNNRFRMKALEATTGDILKEVGFDQMSESLKRDLKEILETADLVKYAKASPLPVANEFAAEFIRRLVAATLDRLKEEAK